MLIFSFSLPHQQLAKIGKRERAMTDGTALGCLRVAVDSGGCHGYQDKLELVQRPEIDD
jgi:Fe-S cluster assembly iron-binding protein IscA